MLAMPRNFQRVQFAGDQGQLLSGVVELPANSQYRMVALFAHCFTCTKDLKAIVKISRSLAEQDICVLRFDFTGLGNSAGDFSDSNFSSNVLDCLAAAEFMQREFAPAQILIGHSLGGAAMFAAAEQIPTAHGIVTLASPSDTQHLAELLSRMNRQIVEQGEGEVEIGGMRYLIRRQLIDDLNGFDLQPHIARWQKPHLLFHSPVDRTLGMAHARRLQAASGDKATLVSLIDADHLFSNDPRDPQFIAEMIALWAKRYVVND
jgi:putative redox protein